MHRTSVLEGAGAFGGGAQAGVSAGVVVALVVAVFLVGFFGLVGLVFFLLGKAAARERRRLAELFAYAAQNGWQPVTAATPVPQPVGEAAASRRSKLAVGARRAYDLWVVWHQWTESTSSGDSTTYTTRNLTRYFLWLGPAYPNVRVSARTSLGALLMPVRGVGTGDPVFDKRFLVRAALPDVAVQLFTPALREAMMTGQVPAWEISAGALILAFPDAPDVHTLEPRAETITYLARMLPRPR